MSFDRYEYYSNAVQSCENDVLFLKKVYRRIRGKDARVLREDFCGTFMLCQEWVKLDSLNKAIGIDLDREPINYGKKRIQKKLTETQKKQIRIVEQSVLSTLPKADLAVALNFSFYIFKKRTELKTYFSQVYKSLNRQGVFVMDTFGGSECYEAHEEKTKHKRFTYYWDQINYDPITNDAKFYIHFRFNGKKRKKEFTYDWRLWSIPELRDILEEVGFKNVEVYWEGTTKKGEGDGVFRPAKVGEECESWIAYISACK